MHAGQILIIEDHKPLLRALKRGLEEAGFTVDIAADGHEGDGRVRSGVYDVIVLDLMLPGIDGTTLIKQWRQQGIATSVLVLTARSSVEDRVLGLDAGADDYLTKPFQFEELLARIRALLRRQHKNNGAVIRVLDLELDTLNRRVHRGGKEIFLTQREYALLHLLAMNRGRVVTRQVVWQHLYQAHEQGGSNVVDVYIRHLRTKIDKDFTPPLIQTRWGEGYLLRDDASSASASACRSLERDEGAAATN